MIKLTTKVWSVTEPNTWSFSCSFSCSCSCFVFFLSPSLCWPHLLSTQLWYFAAEPIMQMYRWSNCCFYCVGAAVASYLIATQQTEKRVQWVERLEKVSWWRLRRMEQKKRASQIGFLQCPAEWMWSRDVRKEASQSYMLHTYPSIYLAIPIPSNKRVSPVGK